MNSNGILAPEEPSHNKHKKSIKMESGDEIQEAVETTTPEPLPADDTKGEGDVEDLFTLLSKTQGNQLHEQRSNMVSPGLDLMNFGLSSILGSDKSSNDLQPLREACTFYHESSKVNEVSELNNDSDGNTANDMVAATGDWILDSPKASSNNANPDASMEMNKEIIEQLLGSDLPETSDVAVETNHPHYDEIELRDPYDNYYDQYFSGQDHTNFVGTSDEVGSVVVSIRREPQDTETFAYRAIIRTSKGVPSTRLLIDESKILRRANNSNPVPPPTIIDVLQRILPETIPYKTLRHARVDPKLPAQLTQMDTCMGNPKNQYKFGILPMKKGQTCDDDFLSNVDTGADLIEFLDKFTSVIKLKGFEKFRGGLDVKDNLDGEESRYTEEQGNECMFHVATMIPYKEGDSQQVLRKRHIGNNLVNILFQDADAPPFDPSKFVSKYTKAFIVIRKENNDSPTNYRVATVRHREVSEFGPELPVGGVFNLNDSSFRTFLINKAINAENACYGAENIHTRLNRTRIALLDNIVSEYSSQIPISQRPGRYSISRVVTMLSAKKRRPLSQHSLDTYGKNAASWIIKTDKDGFVDEATLVISDELVLIMDVATQNTLHQFPSESITAWFTDTEQTSLIIAHGRQGETITLRPHASSFTSLAARLKQLGSIRWHAYALKRDGIETPWGMVLEDNKIASVETSSIASDAGLQNGYELKRVNKCSIDQYEQQDLHTLVSNETHLDLVVSYPTEEQSEGLLENKVEVESTARRTLFEDDGTEITEEASEAPEDERRPSLALQRSFTLLKTETSV
eukprot:m.30354 g.30354  ORF g.30354 m.30354 type:complete len:801 (+) comp8197_c0_seq1:374-2776(+)